MDSTTNNHYGRTAWFYEQAAHLYSGGQILASKRWQLNYINEGDKVLYAGAGSGEDVILAAQKGAQVTVVELAPEMIKKLAKKLEKQGLTESVELICGDAFTHDRLDYYDIVAANYFLNVFSEPLMTKMLKHLSQLMLTNGKLMIADFAPLKGNLIQRALQKIYYLCAVSAFHLIANNPFHPIYHYDEFLAAIEMKSIDDKTFPLAGFGPKWYKALIASK
jgi:demethylmenaquinone methyltransferase/2-methoxy-6-polyprenyl-1,4-benzoquinol methylase